MGASPQNYTLGKGILYIAKYNETAGVTDADYTDIGNCSQLNVNSTQEKLEHYSSRGGINKKDKEVTTQTGYTVTPTTDEITRENLALFLAGRLMPNGEVRALINTEQEYALKYISDNPAGPNYDWYFHRVKITGSGDATLIGADWMTLPLTCEGLADDLWHPASPFFTMRPASAVAKITAWAANKAYAVGDFVTQTTATYRCKAAHTAAATFAATSWTAVDPWQANATVLAGDYVVNGGKVYKAPEAFTAGAAFEADDGYWILTAE